MSTGGPGNQGGNVNGQNPPNSATSSGFNFEPASIFDWTNAHHTAAHHQSQQQQQQQQGPRATASPYYSHSVQQHQQQQQTTQQPAHTLDLVSALASGNNSLNSVGGGQRTNDDDDEDEDDDDDDDDDESGTRQGKLDANGNAGRKRVRGSGPTQRLNKKGGGRPKDFIWAYFDERFTPSPTADNPSAMRHSAACKACGWTCEQPKAFRMRQHVVQNCENLPDAEKQRVQSVQSQKDAATERKKTSNGKRSVSHTNDGADDSLLLGVGNNTSGRVGHDRNDSISATFGDVFSRLNAQHPNGSGSGEPSYFSYSTLASTSGGGDASTSLGSGTLAGTSAPTGADKNIHNNSSAYKTGSAGSSKKKRKKEDSNSNGVGNSWNLSSFLNLAPAKMGKSPITCHVLDSSAGKPGANIKIRMDQLSQTGFMHVATGETDEDGRNNSLLSSTLKIDKNSIFKMTFYTREYFSSKGIDSFYPFVEVVFEVKEPEEHHHIALLLSPFSYTTYRGS